MKDLIARLEKATEPDRELDIAIATVICEYPIVHEKDDGGWVSLPQTVVHITRWAKEYTSSIDDALTLVPKGFAFSLLDLGTFTPKVRPQCEYARPSDAGSDVVDGATPAIALCIAALKARSVANAS